jgi:molybdopterin-guanine dinucleotide biosynthesis protein A
VVADTEADYPGPLAGFLAGLLHCPTPWLLAVPCDTPRFPADLVVRMAAAAHAAGAPLAVALAPDSEAGSASQLQLRAQPAFCLIHRSLLPSLQRFVSEGGRKIDRWTALHPLAQACFDQAGDDPLAYANANTLPEVQALQALPPLPTDPENG